MWFDILERKREKVESDCESNWLFAERRQPVDDWIGQVLTRVPIMPCWIFLLYSSSIVFIFLTLINLLACQKCCRKCSPLFLKLGPISWLPPSRPLVAQALRCCVRVLNLPFRCFDFSSTFNFSKFYQGVNNAVVNFPLAGFSKPPPTIDWLPPTIDNQLPQLDNRAPNHQNGFWSSTRIKSLDH